MSNPFQYFDAIFCINLDRDVGRWQQIEVQAEKLGFVSLLCRFSAVETPGNHHIGCALSHRGVLSEALEQGFEKILVLEDDALFRDDSVSKLQQNVAEIAQHSWDLWYLGGHRWDHHYVLADHCSSLLEVGLRGQEPIGPTCTHAIAYHRGCYQAIIRLLPDTPPAMSHFLAETLPGIDQLYAYGKGLKRLISEPHIASQPPLLPQEDEAFSPVIAEHVLSES